LFQHIAETKTGKVETNDFDLELSIGHALNSKIMNQCFIVTTGPTDNFNNRWYCSYYVPFKGKKKRKKIYLTSSVAYSSVEHKKNELQKLISFTQAELNYKFGVIKTPKDSILVYLEAYISQQQKTTKKRNYGSIEYHTKKFKTFLVGNDLKTIFPSAFTKTTAELYYKFLIDLKIGNKTINNNISAIKSIFNWFIKHHDLHITENPFSAIKKLPTASQTHRVYTIEQLQKIDSYIKKANIPQLRLFIQFVSYAFLRPLEIRMLKIEDINLEQKTIFLKAENAKTGEQTFIPMHQQLVNELQKIDLEKFPPNYYLFGHGQPQETPMGTNYILRRFDKIRKSMKLDKRYTIYSFRHTTVCMLLENGVSSEEVMKLTRHKTLASFYKYARSFFQKKPNINLFDELQILI
jgi:integrase